MNCSVKGTQDVTKTNKASVSPELHKQMSTQTGYARVTVDKSSGIFEIEERFGTTGDQVWVKAGTLKLKLDELKAGTIDAATRRQYRRNLIFNTGEGRLALFGLILALIGLSIKASFTIGDTGSVIWWVTKWEKSALMWISFAFEFVGLWIVFLRGIWFGGK